MNPQYTLTGKDPESLEWCLKTLGISFYFNIRSGRPEFARAGTGWYQPSPREIERIRADIARMFTYQTTRGAAKLQFGREAWDSSLSALMSNYEYDGFLLWAERLPKWDGTPRIDNLLIEMFGAEDNALNRWASKFIFLGSVQRAKEPGCKVDEMPVLIGKQGIGKSAILENVFPPEMVGHWFSSSLNLSDNTQKRVESLLGRVIVEASEMVGVDRAEVNSLKNFLTMRNDGTIRLAYRKDPELMYRRCIMIGTTNEKNCLPNDPTGNRRFVCVELTKGCNVEAKAKREREQWWAEALVRYDAGERSNLPRDLYDMRDSVNQRHSHRSVVLEDWVQQMTEVNKPYLLADLLSHYRMRTPYVTEKQFVKELKNHCFQSARRTINGQRVMVWWRTQ